MKEPKFYICRTCGEIVCAVGPCQVQATCCGKPMEALVPGTVEASREKHIPVVTVGGDTLTVSVGSVAHPMTAEHSIQWVCVVTEQGSFTKKLDTDKEPVAVFALHGDKPVAVFAYCNLHGLWKTDVN